MGLLGLLWGKPSRDQFAKIMVNALQKNGVEGPFEYDAQTFALRFEDHVLNLSNAFADYCQASRRDRARVLAAYLPVVTDGSLIVSVRPSTSVAASAVLSCWCDEKQSTSQNVSSMAAAL